MPDGRLAWVFKPWTVAVIIYDWDLIDAEHSSVLVVAPNMASYQHYLDFYVRRSADDPSIIDVFGIGSTLSLNEFNVDGIWEHIRRFMEDGGPHLPRSSGHDLPPPYAPPSTWWECYKESSLFGGGYWERWREQTFLSIIIHLASPLLFPMGIIWGTGNWLSRKTARPVTWPQEVLDAIGPKLSG